MYRSKMKIRVLSVVVILGLILAITEGISTLVLASAQQQQQQQQNSTSNQSIMIGIANQNVTSTDVNMTTAETNETTTNNIKNVSIVPGATGLENMAYQPNPIKVKVGESITWTNNDLSIHTVTEGNPSSIDSVPTNGFDSGLISPEETFTHTFDKVETIEYHCALHPTMLGKVIVIVS